MRKDEIIELLESLRLPVETDKNVGEVNTVTENKPLNEQSDLFNDVLNDPDLYPRDTPFLINFNNGETVISRTAEGINEGKLNPFEMNWMHVTLYLTDYIRQLLESINSDLIMDVAQAIDDEEIRHSNEDGRYTEVSSFYYGTGKGNPQQFTYSFDNWHNDRDFIPAKDIAEEIIGRRKKAEAYKIKIGNIKSNRTNIEQQDQIDQLQKELAEWREKYNDLLNKQESSEPEEAFNASTNNKCFTKAKMGLLIYTIASMTDGPTPNKTKLAPIIAAITGFQGTSVGREIAKAGFKKNDIDEVAKVFEEAMPKFAEEIRKQVPRKKK